MTVGVLGRRWIGAWVSALDPLSMPDAQGQLAIPLAEVQIDPYGFSDGVGLTIPAGFNGRYRVSAGLSIDTPADLGTALRLIYAAMLDVSSAGTFAAGLTLPVLDTTGSVGSYAVQQLTVGARIVDLDDGDVLSLFGIWNTENAGDADPAIAGPGFDCWILVERVGDRAPAAPII